MTSTSENRQNRRFLLRERPTGRITEQTFEQHVVAAPRPGEGEALVRVSHISLDPSNRGALDPGPSYLPPVGIGEVMRGRGLGRVVESRNPDYPVGTLVLGFVGWQDFAIASAKTPLIKVRELPDTSLTSYLGVYGVTGLTAWVGMNDIGMPKSGETVVVSAAAGAVGSLAGQLAKQAGARVVGIAGGPEKCRIVTEQLGFDAAVDYRLPSFREELARATPAGIDVDFENVGGPVMNAVFERLNVGARVPLCGLIAGYNGEVGAVAASAFSRLLVSRVHLQGFIVLDSLSRLAEVAASYHALVTAGRVRPLETVHHGFEGLPAALNSLFDGKNVGKLLVAINEDAPAARAAGG